MVRSLKKRAKTAMVIVAPFSAVAKLFCNIWRNFRRISAGFFFILDFLGFKGETGFINGYFGYRNVRCGEAANDFWFIFMALHVLCVGSSLWFGFS